MAGLPSSNAHKAKRRKYVEGVKAEAGCIDCPERDPICLDFDHRPGEIKIASVAVMVSQGQSFEKIKAEIAKCDVRCSNCHRKRHRDAKLTKQLCVSSSA